MVGIIIWLILFILSLLMPKSRKLANIIAFFMIIVYGLNTYSGDYLNYEHAYNYESGMVLFKHFEPLFSILITICKLIGLNFTGFRVVLASVFVWFLYKGMDQYTDYIAMAMGLYMIFPFLFFVSVLRAGLACVIFLYYSRYIVIEKNTSKYVFGCLLAMCMHYSSVLFFFALFVGQHMKKIVKIILVAVSSCLGMVYLCTNVIYIILGKLTFREKTLAWASKSIVQQNLNIKGMLAPPMIIIICYLLSMWLFELNSNNIEKCSRTCFGISDFTFGINCLPMLLIPLILINTTWLRIMWELMSFNIICYTNASHFLKDEEDTLAVIPVQFICVIWSIILIILVNMPYAGTENSAFKIFDNNLLLGLLKL